MRSKSMDSAKLRATGENPASSSRVAASITACDASLRLSRDSCCFQEDREGASGEYADVAELFGDR